MNTDTIIFIILMMFFIPGFWAFGKAFGQKESDPKFWFGTTVFKGPIKDRRYWNIWVFCWAGMMLTVIISLVLLALGYIKFG
jgi:hypothetical protein